MIRTLAGGVILVLLIAGAAVVRSREAPRAAEVTAQGGQVDIGPTRISVRFPSFPPAASSEAPVEVRVNSNGEPVSLDGGLISFSMAMPMAAPRYRLVRREAGLFTATVFLPSCASGGRRWIATVEGTVKGEPVVARFGFEVAASARGAR